MSQLNKTKTDVMLLLWQQLPNTKDQAGISSYIAPILHTELFDSRFKPQIVEEVSITVDRQ